MSCPTCKELAPKVDRLIEAVERQQRSHAIDLEELRETLIKTAAALPYSAEFFHDAIDEAFAAAIDEESRRMGDVR